MWAGAGVVVAAAVSAVNVVLEGTCSIASPLTARSPPM